MSSVLKRQILGVVLFISIFVGFIFFYNFLTTATVKITTNPEAIISYTYNPNTSFEELAKGSATIKNKDQDYLYIRVSEGSKITQKNVKLERRKTKNITIGLSEPTSHKVVAEGSLKEIYNTSEFAYGLNPNNLGFTFAAKTPGEVPSQLFLDVPKAERIHWNSPNNFIYTRLGGGVVAYNNGSKTDYPNMIDFAVYDQTFYLLEKSAIYTSNNLFNKSQLTKAFDITSFDREKIYVDSGGIFTAGARNEADFDQPSEETVEDITATQISYYTLDGELIQSFFVDASDSIDRVVSFGDTIVTVGNNDLFFHSKATGQPELFYNSVFGAQDIFFSEDKAYVLAPQGVWLFDPSENTYQRIVKESPGLLYTRGSFTKQGNKLYYSTNQGGATRSSTSSDKNGRVYEINL